MGADNATNQARQREAEARVRAAVEALRQRGEPLGLRALAREAGASLTTVRKLRHLWQPDSAGPPDTEDTADGASWQDRLAAFRPHTVTEYLQSVWPEPVTLDTYARWYAEMICLRRLYGSRTIHLAPATYRMYADWMNCILDDARQHFSLRALEYAIERWQDDPVDALQADGAIAGVQLPKAVKDTLQTMCQHGTLMTVADAQHQPAMTERSAPC